MRIYIIIILFLCSLSVTAQSGLNKTKTIGSGVTPSEWNTLVNNQDQLLEYVASEGVSVHINSDTTLTSVSVATTFLVDATSDTVNLYLPEVTSTSTHKPVQVKLMYNGNPVCLYASSGQTIEGDECERIYNLKEAFTVRQDADSLTWVVVQDSRSKAVADVIAVIDSSINTSVTANEAWYYMNGRFDNQKTLNFGIVNDTLTYIGVVDSIRIYIHFNGTVTASTAQTNVGIRIMQNGEYIPYSVRHTQVVNTNGLASITGETSTILRIGDNFHFEINGNKTTTVAVPEFYTRLYDTRR